MTQICVSDLTISGSDNGLSPGGCQAIIRTNAGILLIRPLGTNFSEIVFEILIFSFKKMCLKVSSAKRRPFCLGLNEIMNLDSVTTAHHVWVEQRPGNSIMASISCSSSSNSKCHPDSYQITSWHVNWIDHYISLTPWYFYTASSKLKGGYTGFTLSNCLSVDSIVSALYLQQYLSDPFHICTPYQATSEGVLRIMFVTKYQNLKIWQILLICNFDFVLLWLVIQCDSVVWVIMRRRGVSSERRRSSCSSFY